MNPENRMMAWAQIIFTGMLLLMTFAMIMVYELGASHLNVDQAKTLERWGDWFTGASFLALVFWFQRMRTGGIPDATQMVTQSHTAPDGTKTTVTSPINAPAASVPTLPSTTTATIAPLDKTPGVPK